MCLYGSSCLSGLFSSVVSILLSFPLFSLANHCLGNRFYRVSYNEFCWLCLHCPPYFVEIGTSRVCRCRSFSTYVMKGGHCLKWHSFVSGFSQHTVGDSHLYSVELGVFRSSSVQVNSSQFSPLLPYSLVGNGCAESDVSLRARVYTFTTCQSIHKQYIAFLRLSLISSIVLTLYLAFHRKR